MGYCPKCQTERLPIFVICPYCNTGLLDRPPAREPVSLRAAAKLLGVLGVAFVTVGGLLAALLTLDPVRAGYLRDLVSSVGSGNFGGSPLGPGSGISGFLFLPWILFGLLGIISWILRNFGKRTKGT